MYDQICALSSESAEDTLTLEQYLSSLWKVVSAERDKPLSNERFVAWLAAAFVQEPLPFEPEWLNVVQGDIYLRETYDDANFADWENLILFQIADLKRMAEAGILDNEYKHFGIDSPSGERWYNFDLAGYLECAAAAMYGRNGDPAGEDEPVIWGDFIQFLICGQIFE